MTTPPASPSPADPDAQRADADAHALAMLRQLAELTLELATALQANALTQVHLANTLAEPVPQASVAAFDTIARGVRRTALTLRHLAHPEAVAGATVMRVAALGIAINGATALMFMRGRHDDLNIRGAFLHMAGDAAVSAGVVLAAGLILLTGATWLDPLASLAIVAVIAWSTWGLLRESLSLAMDAVPAGLAPAQVDAFLRTLPGVSEVHDLHIWGLSTSTTALTAHLVRADAAPTEPDQLIRAACDGVRERFGIGHCTFQVETTRGAAACTLRPSEVV